MTRVGCAHHLLRYVPRVVVLIFPYYITDAYTQPVELEDTILEVMATDNTNTASPKIHRMALSPSQDISTSCADNLSSEQQDPLIFTEPVPVTSLITPLPPSSPGANNDWSMERSYDVHAPPSPLPSSPVPSSSPPNFFASSPPLDFLEKSPVTSPAPIGKLPAVLSTMYANPLKRPRSPHEAVISAGDQDDLGEGPVKKKARYTHETLVYGTHAVFRSRTITNPLSLNGARTFPDVENT